MKNEYTNGILFDLANILTSNEWIEKKRHLKTNMSIRHMLKVNTVELANKAKIINDEIKELISDTDEDYISSGKAKSADGVCVINDDCVDEYNNCLQKKLDELSVQKMPVNFIYVDGADIERYFALNDGELTYEEMDAIEMFANNETSEEDGDDA